MFLLALGAQLVSKLTTAAADPAALPLEQEISVSLGDQRNIPLSHEGLEGEKVLG